MVEMSNNLIVATLICIWHVKTINYALRGDKNYELSLNVVEQSVRERQRAIEKEKKKNRRDYDVNTKFWAGLTAVREINCQGKIFLNEILY